MKETVSDFLVPFLQNGKRNSGDNLLGFKMDLDAYLEDVDCFKHFNVEEKPDKDFMFEIFGTLLSNADIPKVMDAIKATWLTNLRYKENEGHMFEIIEHGFIFYFYTFSNDLGVSGRLICKESLV